MLIEAVHPDELCVLHPMTHEVRPGHVVRDDSGRFSRSWGIVVSTSAIKAVVAWTVHEPASMVEAMAHQIQQQIDAEIFYVLGEAAR